MSDISSRMAKASSKAVSGCAPSAVHFPHDCQISQRNRAQPLLEIAQSHSEALLEQTKPAQVRTTLAWAAMVKDYRSAETAY
jgi:hypothetical protein